MIRDRVGLGLALSLSLSFSLSCVASCLVYFTPHPDLTLTSHGKRQDPERNVTVSMIEVHPSKLQP